MAVFYSTESRVVKKLLRLDSETAKGDYLQMEKVKKGLGENGAGDEARTRNFQLGKLTLYH